MQTQQLESLKLPQHSYIPTLQGLPNMLMSHHAVGGTNSRASNEHHIRSEGSSACKPQTQKPAHTIQAIVIKIKLHHAMVVNATHGGTAAPHCVAQPEPRPGPGQTRPSLVGCSSLPASSCWVQRLLQQSMSRVNHTVCTSTTCESTQATPINKQLAAPSRAWRFGLWVRGRHACASKAGLCGRGFHCTKGCLWLGRWHT